MTQRARLVFCVTSKWEGYIPIVASSGVVELAKVELYDKCVDQRCQDYTLESPNGYKENDATPRPIVGVNAVYKALSSPITPTLVSTKKVPR